MNTRLICCIWKHRSTPQLLSPLFHMGIYWWCPTWAFWPTTRLLGILVLVSLQENLNFKTFTKLSENRILLELHDSFLVFYICLTHIQFKFGNSPVLLQLACIETTILLPFLYLCIISLYQFYLNHAMAKKKNKIAINSFGEQTRLTLGKHAPQLLETE